MNNISVFGASGHAKVVIDILELIGLKIKFIFDNNINREKIFDYDVCHDFTKIDSNTFVAIGNNSARKKIVEQYNLMPTYIIHPSSNLSSHIELGLGTVIMAGVSINADVKIGKHCILNTNCSIDHDCIIEDYSHISPNVSLAGNVTIGEGTHVGIGASIIQGVKIGTNCVIGAGTVIIKDVPENSIIVGNPGRVIKKNLNS